jgi:hypothetical protein
MMMMVKRPKTGRVMGYLSLALSLLYWMLSGLDAAKHHFNREQFMLFLDDLFYVWLLVWPLGFLLSIAGMVLGSRRWGLATLLPVLSCWISMSLLSSIPF